MLKNKKAPFKAKMLQKKQQVMSVTTLDIDNQLLCSSKPECSEKVIADLYKRDDFGDKIVERLEEKGIYIVHVYL